MTTATTPSSLALIPSLKTAWQDVDSSFESFCLKAGIGAIEQIYARTRSSLSARGIIVAGWGRTKGKIGFHGGGAAARG
jgi:hypothetical protein